MRRSLRRGLAATVGALLLVGCSSDSNSDSDTSTPEASLRVEDIRPAMAAVEAELGAPQRFFEVNATPTLVNLFVATENGTKAVAYVYALGKLQAPAAPQDASGPTFAAGEVDFDEKTVLEPLVAALPNSRLRVFSTVGVDTGGVSYLVTIDSAQGGELQVPVGPDGQILGATPG